MNDLTAPCPASATRTPLVLAVAPVLGVERGHVAEARRALRAQGKELDDDDLVQLLWTARALPAALDVLADGRCPHPLEDLVLTDAVVEAEIAEAGQALVGRPLLAISRLEDGPPLEVVVLIVERQALLHAADDYVEPRCTVRFRTVSRTVSRTGSTSDDDVASEDRVQLRRFRLNRPS